MITSEEVRQSLKEDNYYIVVDYITQQENIKKKLKRYFKLLNEDKISDNQLYRNEFVKIVKELWEWSELNDNK